MPCGHPVGPRCQGQPACASRHSLPHPHTHTCPHAHAPPPAGLPLPRRRLCQARAHRVRGAPHRPAALPGHAGHGGRGRGRDAVLGGWREGGKGKEGSEGWMWESCGGGGGDRHPFSPSKCWGGEAGTRGEAAPQARQRARRGRGKPSTACLHGRALSGGLPGHPPGGRAGACARFSTAHPPPDLFPRLQVDNLFKNDKAPYCSNCSFNADCLALLLVSGGAGHGRAAPAHCGPGGCQPAGQPAQATAAPAATCGTSHRGLSCPPLLTIQHPN